MRKITIKDVANLAGVSVAAVSYVLNGKHHKVSEETVEKINEAIKTLNYIPNISARGLAKNKSQLIGVIIPQTEDRKSIVLENPFYSETISAIESVMRSEGYHILLSGVEKGKSYLDISVSRNLDGAIIMGVYPEQLYEECKKVGIPIVLIDSYIHDNYFRNVGIDDELGGYMATKYLIDQGHRNIAMIAGMIRSSGVVEKRYLGYKRALQEAGLFYNPNYVFERSVSYEHGLETGRTIADDYPEITAVFAMADIVAYGAIRGIWERGKRIPDDISVIGFDDLPMSSMFVPALTTVSQHIKKKGELAARILLDEINERSEMTYEEIELEIIERESVRSLL